MGVDPGREGVKEQAWNSNLSHLAFLDSSIIRLWKKKSLEVWRIQRDTWLTGARPLKKNVSNAIPPSMGMQQPKLAP